MILGGTAEAVELARRAAANPKIEVVSSLAGRTSRPRRPAGGLRVGGFGGVDGLLDYLHQGAIDLLVDATHPYAAVISHNADQACRRAGIERLSLVRPAWRAEPNDRWIEVPDAAAAAARLPDLGHRAFLTLGRRDLEVFASRAGIWFLVRLIEVRPPTGFADATFIQDRGPFTRQAELALMREHRIDCLVSKNSGGEATHGKILAARELSLPVLMIARPPPPGGAQVASVMEAQDWLGQRIREG